MDLALWRERIVYQGGLLALSTFLTSAALVLANRATVSAIEQAAQDDLKQSLTQVLPEGMADNDLLADALEVADTGGRKVNVYRGRKAGQFSAAVFEYRARGYAGDIVILLGVDPAGAVTGVRVLRHSETPGLGDKIEAAKSDWIHAFEQKSLAGMPLASWAVKKDGGVFDQFAGATITPRAVVKAVREGLQFYAAHQAEISEAAR
ncbi:electron transport complex subunit RsxG [Niveibacterium sp. 24ML]|uniref:electron transport complex subunit RsxG n=1 Tax=Niveibacterium sp. 24ML TaxID=2985512 RepID=UPI00226F8BBE|nr:electron transport complex subunit RsxG [Niveibacterium sp. 24ML]MCX9154643.1 electron transport complex subunit RsxG [Niveibacterium sp. 24ML]